MKVLICLFALVFVASAFPNRFEKELLDDLERNMERRLVDPPGGDSGPDEPDSAGGDSATGGGGEGGAGGAGGEGGAGGAGGEGAPGVEVAEEVKMLKELMNNDEVREGVRDLIKAVVDAIAEHEEEEGPPEEPEAGTGGETPPERRNFNAMKRKMLQRALTINKVL